VTYNFTGVVSSVDAALTPGPGPVAPGNALSGSFSYETTAPANGLGNPETYDALTSLSFTVGGYSASLLGSKQIIVADSFFGKDLFQINAKAADGLSGPPINGFNLFIFSFELFDSSNSVFSSAALPALLNFGSFDSAEFLLSFLSPLNGNTQANITGRITDVSLAEAPIPGAGLLFAGGLGMIGFLAHRRRRKAAGAVA
jgi:hypothetical protein